MYGDSNPTGAFGSVQLVLIGVVVLAIGGAFGLVFGLSLLGVSGVSVGAVFLLLLFVLLALAWPLFRNAQPPRDWDRE